MNNIIRFYPKIKLHEVGFVFDGTNVIVKKGCTAKINNRLAEFELHGNKMIVHSKKPFRDGDVVSVVAMNDKGTKYASAAKFMEVPEFLQGR